MGDSAVFTIKKGTPKKFPSSGFMVLATTYSRTTYRCTTIGERSFHFRVRYGYGWFQASKVTRLLAQGSYWVRLGRTSLPFAGCLVSSRRYQRTVCSLKIIGKGPLF